MFGDLLASAVGGDGNGGDDDQGEEDEGVHGVVVPEMRLLCDV